MNRKIMLLIVALICAGTVLALQAAGRIWWCASGDWSPWISNVLSSHCSQHLFDPYSFSHMLHGFIFYCFLWLLFRNKFPQFKVIAAVCIEVGWEILENSPIIIERYRAATVSLNYSGDSIANSLGDVISCSVGYFIATRAPAWMTICIAIATELVLLLIIRDNLTLNVLMLLWPIEGVRQWQMQ